MGRLIGFGSDCFGCGMGEDPALPGALDPAVITGAIPPSLTPATTDQVATMAESVKKDMLYYAIGAVGVALLLDWFVFGKKSYKANARRGHLIVRVRDSHTQKKGRGRRILDRRTWALAEDLFRMGKDSDLFWEFAEDRLRKGDDLNVVVKLLQQRGLTKREASDVVNDIVIYKLRGWE